MNINVEELGMCQVQLTVEPEAAQIEQAKKEVAKKYRKQVKIRGFRAGKAPLPMVMRALGEQQLIDEVVKLIAQDVFVQALDQANLQIYSYDDLHSEIATYDPLTYRFTFPCMPIIKLGELKWIQVTPKEVSLSDDQLYRTLADIRRRFATVENITGPAQYGDQAVYDLRIEAQDGTTVADETNRREQLTTTPNESEQDSSTPINLSSYLVGLNVDEPHEFQLIYPKHWGNGQFGGQTMTYHVTLKELKRVVLPELNDEFAQTMAHMPTMDAWQEKMSRDLLAQARRDEINRVNIEILNGLVEESEIEYPQLMLKAQISQHVASLEQQWKNRGTTLAEQLKKEGRTLDELEDDMRDDVEQELLRSLVLNQYVIANEISVTGEELQQEFENVLRPYGPDAGINIEQLQKDENFLFQLQNEVLTRKGLTHIYTTVVGEAPPALYDEDEVEVIVEDTSETNASDAEEVATPDGEEVGVSNEAVDSPTEEATEEQ